LIVVAGIFEIWLVDIFGKNNLEVHSIS